MELQKKYITGRNSESFTDLEEAKKYADKWRDKSISVYQDGKYHSTIHKKDGIMKEIETSKGRFLICDDGCDEFESLLYFFRCYKLSEITEEQASSIVKMTWINNDERLCRYKNYDINGNGSFSSSIDSLHSLIESQGIEITNNTYIFKI